MENHDLTNEQLVEQIRALQERINSLEKTATAQGQTEDALSASEKNLSAILEKNADGIVIVDTDGAVLYANPAAEQLFGKSKEEFLGYPFGFPVSADKAEDSLVIRKGNTLCEAELRVVQVQWHKQPAFQLSVRDITYRKQAEMALEESEKLYSSFINATSDMVYVKDEQFRHLVVNQALADFFGKDQTDIIGKTDFELMPTYAAEKCRADDIQAIRSKLVVITEEVVGDRIYETNKFRVPLQDNRIGVGGIIPALSRWPNYLYNNIGKNDYYGQKAVHRL